MKAVYFLMFWYIHVYRNKYTQTHGRKLELEIHFDTLVQQQDSL